MTVKTIFQTLIGTIVVIVVTSCLVELFNISTTGTQIKQMMKMSAKQSCVLFGQETYKTDNVSGAANMPNIVAPDGSLYVSGTFYNGTALDVWENIYKADGDFADFVNCTGSKNTFILPSGYSSLQNAYEELEILKISTNTADINAFFANDNNKPGWDDADDSQKVKKYNKYSKASAYRTNLYTTANIGIPYMHDETINKIFKWNLTQILSNCDPDLIQIDPTAPDDAHKYFVNYKGFQCFPNLAEITHYTYTTFDLTNSTDKAKFNSMTGMNANSLGINNTNNKSNKMVTVVTIDYKMPMNYVGITPIRNIFEYVWDIEVQGLANTPPDKPNTNWNSTAQDLTSTSTATGGYIKTGKLNYVLVR